MPYNNTLDLKIQYTLDDSLIATRLLLNVGGIFSDPGLSKETSTLLVAKKGKVSLLINTTVDFNNTLKVFMRTKCVRPFDSGIVKNSVTEKTFFWLEKDI